ncbi:MAG: Hsp20/alpha crystallin family protein [Candidatus Falkowbacteria bacterium]
MLFNKQNTKSPLIQEDTEPSIAQWFEEDNETDGQLAIDVFQTSKQIIIKSTIAGVKPEDLKISLHHDLLTIKGSRSVKEDVREEDYLFRECYWGSFSRSIILPAEVDSHRVEAELESGVLTITLYKSNSGQIEVKEKD